MLSLSKWRRRISKAWRKKVKRKKHKPDPPKEVTTRWQEVDMNRENGKQFSFLVIRCRVTLMLWPDRHSWQIARWIGNKLEKWVRVQVDRPLSQAELFRWLAKTQPIE